MVARARERFASERRHLERRRRQAKRAGALPNLIVIGGLKCGTTSLHHYLNLHPQVAMSRPKELNFFVAELNWELGADWYASHFDRTAQVRGETSPHYTNLPRFAGVADRMFGALADKGINIQVISTSEIKISVLIAEDYTELAVRALHSAYGLDSD